MPKRVDSLRKYFVTRPDCAVDDGLQKCLDAYGARECYAQPLVDERFLVSFQQGYESKSEAWRAKYLTCDEFFREFSPLPGRFTIFRLWARQLDYPGFKVLWTDADSPVLAAALNQEKPVLWGSGNDYLFGQQLWEMTKSDKEVGEEEQRLLFLEAFDRDRRKFERLRRKFSGGAGAVLLAKREAIAEEVRIFVWRRDGGRCAQCGSQERLEFDHIIPVIKGGGNTERNVQLLCEACNRKKSDTI
jgi:hypothetical protein